MKFKKIFGSMLFRVTDGEFRMGDIIEMPDSIFWCGDVESWVEDPDIEYDYEEVKLSDIDNIRLNFGDLEPENIFLCLKEGVPCSLIFAADVDVETMTDKEIMDDLWESDSWDDGVSAELLLVMAERRGLDVDAFETYDDLYDVIRGKKEEPYIDVCGYKDNFTSLFPEECDEDGNPTWNDNLITVWIPFSLWTRWIKEDEENILNGLTDFDLREYRNSSQSLPVFYYENVYEADEIDSFIPYCVKHGYEPVRCDDEVKFVKNVGADCGN